MANSLVSSVTGSVPGGSALSAIASQYFTDRVLIRNRDQLHTFFKSNAASFPGWEAMNNKNKLAHADIPNRKLGKTYDPEWSRLYQFVLDVAGIYSPTLSNEIRQRIPLYTAPAHDVNGTIQLMKDFINSYPKGYVATSTVPNMKLGDQNPLTMINKDQNAGSLTYPGSIDPNSIATPGRDMDLIDYTKTGDKPKSLQAGFSIGSLDMTTMILIILAIIVAFFLFR